MFDQIIIILGWILFISMLSCGSWVLIGWVLKELDKPKPNRKTSNPYGIKKPEPMYPSALPKTITDDPKIMRKVRLDILGTARFDLIDLGFAMKRLPLRPGHRYLELIDNMRNILEAAQEYQSVTPALIHSPHFDNYIDYMILTTLDKRLKEYIQPFNNDISYQKVYTMLVTKDFDNQSSISRLIRERYLNIMGNQMTEQEILQRNNLYDENWNG